MRLRRVLITFLIVLGVAISPQVAAAKVNLPDVEYSGSFSYRITDSGPKGTTVQTRGLSWVMTLHNEGDAVRKSFAAEGSSTISDSDGSGDSCSISQRTRSIVGPFDVEFGSNLKRVNVSTFVPSDVDSAVGNLTVSGGYCNGLNGQHGVLFSTPNADGSLGTGNPCWGFTKAPQFINPRVDKNLKFDVTKKIDRQQTAIRFPNCDTHEDIVATREIHATLRVGAGSAVRTGPTPSEVQKAFATSDLLTSILRAQLPCGYVGLGLGTAIWVSTVGGPSAPAALVPAYVLISYGEPLCAAYAKRIFDDISIANDPPVGNLNTLAQPKPTRSGAEAAATLASCDNQPADQQAFCAQLRAAAGDEVAAAEKVASIDDALLATVDRESKASKTHNAKALKRQQKWGNKLLSQLQSAALAEDTTWRAINQMLGAQNLTGHLTLEQDAAGINNLLARLKADGVSASQVKRLAAGALVPSVVDLLAN